MTKKPPKVYAYGAVGRGKDIEKLFEQVGIKNTLGHKFGNSSEIYFVDQKGQISIAEVGSDLYYIIESSDDWKELKLKQPKKERKFLITVKEGSSSCDGCAALNKCTEIQKAKCQLVRHLNNLFEDKEMSGKCLDIVEVDTSVEPITPYTKEDFDGYY